jgi:flagellar basal-body rod protein FlgB
VGKEFALIDTKFMEKALDAASLRQQVIANNISNANTEGFQSQRVEFEGHLKEAMENEAAEGKDESLAVKNAVDPDMAIDGTGGWDKSSLKPTVETAEGKMNINSEMAGLAKNQIMYNALATKISGVYGALKWVVENSGR